MIRLVVRVKLEDMSSKILYPKDEDKDERVALLTGIIQLVSTALKREGPAFSSEEQMSFMKSDRGVIGYIQHEDDLFICEGDNESETGDVLRAVMRSPDTSSSSIADEIDKELSKRGREISGLWK